MLSKLFPRRARGKWENQMNFVVSLLGLTIGLEDVLFLPMSLSQNAGSHRIAYLITMLFVGIPLMSMELFLGQFTSTGPTTCWQFAPVFQGVGVSSVVLAAFYCITQQVYLAWTMLILFKSLNTRLPWRSCDREWASDHCSDFVNVSSAVYCRSMGWNVSENGACYDEDVFKSVWNLTMASNSGINRNLPAFEYVMKEIFGLPISGLGEQHWEQLGCLVVVWVIIVMALLWGLKGLIKVVYAAMGYILVALVVQMVYVLTLDGAADGIQNYFTLSIESLSDSTVWFRASLQVLTTLSVNTGTLPCLASFNTFKGDCFMYASASVCCNLLISTLSTCIITALIGHVSISLSTPLLVPEGAGSSFVLFLHALTTLPWGPLWSVMFSLMVFIAGMSTAAVYVQTVVTSTMDLYPHYRRYKNVFLVVFCGVCFLLELPLLTGTGAHFILVVDKSIVSINLYVLPLLGCMAVSWVYGVYHFMDDINLMVVTTVCGCLPWNLVKYFMCLSWTLVCPVFLLFNLFTNLRLMLPQQASKEVISQLVITAVILVPIPVYVVRSLCTKRGSYLYRVRSLMRPTEFWGPVLPKERNIWLSVQKHITRASSGHLPIHNSLLYVPPIQAALPLDETRSLHSSLCVPVDDKLPVCLSPIPVHAFSGDVFAAITQSSDLPALRNPELPPLLEQGQSPEHSVVDHPP